MRIQHNIMAMNAYRNYTNNTSAVAKNLEKLSSGYRINRAGDDAAGLSLHDALPISGGVVAGAVDHRPVRRSEEREGRHLPGEDR